MLVYSQAKKQRGFRLQDLPVSVQFTLVCVGLCIALVLALTTIGYIQARDGLREQARAALRADALVVTTSVDQWNADRLKTLQILASMTALQQYLEVGAAGRPNYQNAVQDALVSMDIIEKEVDSIAILEPTGIILASSNVKDLGQNVGQRDYFQNAMRGESFISGVSISTITNAPAIFHSAPIKSEAGKVLGVIRSRASLDAVMQTAQAAQSRVGSGAEGVLIDQDGLVIANTLDATWLLRPIVALKPEVNATMTKDKRWGNNSQPDALGLNDLTQATDIRESRTFNWHLGKQDYQVVALPMQSTRWSYATALPVATFQAAADDYLRVTSLVALAALFVAFLLSFFGSRNISTPLNQTVQMLQEMGKGRLQRRLRMNRRDEIGALANTMDKLADDLQTLLSGNLAKIADGDLSMEITFFDEKDEIAAAEVKIIESLRALVTEFNGLTQAAIQGKLATRGDPSKFKGGFRQVVQGMNDTLDAVIGPLTVAAEYIDRISKGDIPAKITDNYHGDFNEIKNNLNQCIDSIDVLRDELRVVLYAAREGNLSQRTNPERATGSYHRILSAMNDALDVMADKIFWYEQLLDAIPLALSVTDLDLKWTFVNKPIEKFFGKPRQELIGRPCSDWNASICKTENCGVECLRRNKRRVTFQRDQRDYQVETAFVLNSHGEKIGHIEVVRDVTATARRNAYTVVELDRITGNMQKLADGDLTLDLKVAEPDEHTQLTHDNYVRLNTSLGQVRDAIAALVTDANTLTHAAIEGKLSTRVDASKHQGEFRKIVQGINDTLDAVIGPLRAAAEYIDRIARGDTAFTVQEEYRGDFNTIKNNLNQCTHQISLLVDEVGIIINAAREGKLSQRANADRTAGVYRKILRGLNDTVDAMIAPIETTKQALGLVAQGDLTVELNGHYKGEFELLRDSIETMMQGLKGMATQTQSSAVSISVATNQILSSSTQMAATTREQASAVNQVTSTVKEIKVSAEQVAQSAEGVAAASNQALAAAEKGMAAVEDTIAGMNDIRAKVEMIAENILALSEQTQQIGEIIDTVSDIAGQSNILALNAAIEAAQAGEAGKGFRVVADEVRTLAAQSRQAAAQVKTILGDIQRATNQAVMATEQGTKGVQAGSQQVERTAQTIQELARVVETSANAAQQIVAGIEQQTIGLDQIVIGMNDINQAAQQSASGAQQSQHAAEDLTTQAAKLKQAVAQYKM